MAEGGVAPLVVLETNMGQIVIELYSKHCPRTVNNFVELSRKGYYNGIRVSR